MPCGNSSSLPQLEQKTVPSVRSWQFQQTSGASADVGTVFITFSKTPHQAQKKWLASAAANHFSNPPLEPPTRAKQGEGPHKSLPAAGRSRLLRRERAAAAAIPRRVGVPKDKSLAHQRLFVLERRAIQVQKALGVHENARAVLLEDFVAVARLRIQAHRIGQSGAAAALHAHTQPANFRRHAFLFEQRPDLSGGALGQVDGSDVRDPSFFICVSVHSKAVSTCPIGTDDDPLSSLLRFHDPPRRPPERRQVWLEQSLVRRLFRRWEFDAVLFLPIADGGLDGV